MSKKDNNDFHIIEMTIEESDCSYSYHIEEKRYSHKEYDYDGYLLILEVIQRNIMNLLK